MSLYDVSWRCIDASLPASGDLLCYCNDVLDLEIEGICDSLTGALWQVCYVGAEYHRHVRGKQLALNPRRHMHQGLVEPLFAAIRAEDADASGAVVEPTAAFYVLSRLCHSLTYQPLLTAIMDALLSRPGDGSSENQHRQAIVRALSDCSCDSKAVSALCLLGVFASSRVADDAALGARAHVPHHPVPVFVRCNSQLIFDLSPVSLCHLSDAVGLLPARRRTTMRLMAALTASPQLLQPPAVSHDSSKPQAAAGTEEALDDTELMVPTPPQIADGAGEEAAAPASPARQVGNAILLAHAAVPCAALTELTDALAAFIATCCASDSTAHLQALSYATWLLRELAVSPQASATAAQAEQQRRMVTGGQADLLHAAADAAAAALGHHLQGPWGDAVAPLLCAHWKLGSRVGEQPALGDEHVAALVFSCAIAGVVTRAPADGGAGDSAGTAGVPGSPHDRVASRSSAATPTAPAAERALLSVRRCIVVRAACAVALGQPLEAAPPLEALPEAYAGSAEELREGAAAPATAADGVPCRVAFERGKERRVKLSAAACSIPLAGNESCVTGLLLLADAAAAHVGSDADVGAATSADSAAASSQTVMGGLIRAVAPAAGAEVRTSCIATLCIHA
jgi:hypothetical protein